MYDESGLLQFLSKHNIEFKRVEHPPVFTCEEAERLRMPLPAVHTKNLFLKDENRKHYFLVMTRCGKRVDTNALGKILGLRKLHLASPEELQALLGVTPGAVTVLAVINDPDRQVELIVDEEVWEGQNFTCHPLVNTATLVISKAGLIEFFILSGHSIRMMQLDTK